MGQFFFKDLMQRMHRESRGSGEQANLNAKKSKETNPIKLKPDLLACSCCTARFTNADTVSHNSSGKDIVSPCGRIHSSKTQAKAQHHTVGKRFLFLLKRHREYYVL